MPGRRSRPRSGSSARLRRGNRQPGWRGRAALVAVSHSAGQSSRLDGDSDVVQRKPRFRVIRVGHAVKLTQQVSRGPSQETRAVRAELVSRGPPHVPLYSLPGAPG